MMPRVIPLVHSVLAALALAGHAAPAAAAPADNVLLLWREQLARCGQRSYGEIYTMRDVDALVHVAMFEAVNAIARKYTPYVARIEAAPGSSMEAAAAQAAHDVLARTCTAQAAGFADVLRASLAAVPEAAAREGGVEVGRRAAAAVLEARAGSRANGADPYWTTTTAGTYVPTTAERGRLWSRMAPWVMRSPEEVRPAAPPALASADWRRDLEEVQRLGGQRSGARSRAQTDLAQFWGARDVRIVLRQVVGLPGRSLVDDARLLALAEMAWADSYVAMMDGKYAYSFWRPVTAIRHADAAGAASMDPAWEPLISTPPHPEYPCGHCLSAAAVGTVIALELGDRMPTIVFDQDNAMLRRYATAAEYIADVGESRILAGVHYRFSVDAGNVAGAAIGRLAHERYFRPVASRTSPSARPR